MRILEAIRKEGRGNRLSSKQLREEEENYECGKRKVRWKVQIWWKWQLRHLPAGEGMRYINVTLQIHGDKGGVCDLDYGMQYIIK